MKKSTKIGLFFGLAYLIDRIFYPEKYRKKEPKLSIELKYGASDTVPREKIIFDPPKDILCPYCEYRFLEMVKRKRKCPKCKKSIYIMNDYEKRTTWLITEEEKVKDDIAAAQINWESSIEESRERLLRYKDAGVKKVKISTAGDASCPACRSQRGKIYSIEKAFKEMPVPCKSCTFDTHGVEGERGWCRCLYTPELD